MLFCIWENLPKRTISVAKWKTFALGKWVWNNVNKGRIKSHLHLQIPSACLDFFSTASPLLLHLIPIITVKYFLPTTHPTYPPITHIHLLLLSSIPVPYHFHLYHFLQFFYPFYIILNPPYPCNLPLYSPPPLQLGPSPLSFLWVKVKPHL